MCTRLFRDDSDFATKINGHVDYKTGGADARFSRSLHIRPHFSSAPIFFSVLLLSRFLYLTRFLIVAFTKFCFVRDLRKPWLSAPEAIPLTGCVAMEIKALTSDMAVKRSGQCATEVSVAIRVPSSLEYYTLK
ncbi:hypothetical protein ACTXT7_016962 [Hymenolepis weldensis]